MNEVLWLALMLTTFTGVLLAFRFFGRTGLYIWTAMGVILANLQVLKIVQLFGLTATMGNIIYGSLFLVTDILNEFYGEKEARKAVYAGFFALIDTTIIMQLCLVFSPAPEDFIQPALAEIFGFLPRVAAASLIAYLISQLHDVWAYALWRKVLPGNRWLWVRNNFSTMISQLIDSVLFCTLAFAGVYPQEVFWSVLVTTYLFKFVTALLDTPFIYLSVGVWKRLDPSLK